MLLDVNAVLWVLGFSSLAYKTYTVGVYMYDNDRAWRVVATLIAGVSISAAWVMWRRPNRLVQLGPWASVACGVVLLASMLFAVVVGVFGVAAEARA